jgi:surface protein
MSFVEFNYLSHYMSREIDAYFRYELTDKNLKRKRNYNNRNVKGIFPNRFSKYGYATDCNTSSLTRLHFSYKVRDWGIAEETFFDSDFNENIENWDVSNVRNMINTFENCEHFNQPLNKWNVAEVGNMYSIFKGCRRFNQPLNDWNVSGVEMMNEMFSGCVRFNQPLDKWNVSNASDMCSMFEDCHHFKQELKNWNTSGVCNMYGVFKNTPMLNSNKPPEYENDEFIWDFDTDYDDDQDESEEDDYDD